MITPIVPPTSPLQELLHGPASAPQVRTADPDTVYGLCTLDVAGRVVDKSDNHREGGATSRDVLANIRAATEQGWDLAFLGCGINDVWRGHHGRTAEAVDIDTYTDNLRTALELLTMAADRHRHRRAALRLETRHRRRRRQRRARPLQRPRPHHRRRLRGRLHRPVGALPLRRRRARLVHHQPHPARRRHEQPLERRRTPRRTRRPPHGRR